jgi:hypothetical protein
MRIHISEVNDVDLCFYQSDDELLIIPGSFTIPLGGGASTAPRVTRIYVSTLASVVNGAFVSSKIIPILNLHR